ncbi:TPM domain-containing protein [candidate division KSB1 bacterium]|nr:TPM domain-containing protein [candidate division KSB1 bacterium]
MKIDKLFSEGDLSEIREAVHKAEGNISGEIAPVLVERCSPYSIAYYRAFILSGAIAAAIIILIDQWYSPFIFYSPLISILTITAAAMLGTALIFFRPELKKLFISGAMMEQNIYERAEKYFLDQELYKTRQRTGILILVALYEKRVVIKADKGIAEVVEQNVWDELVDSFIAYGKQGDIKAGLIKIIRDCAVLLQEKGFVKTEDDINELSDDVRIAR